MYRVEDGADAGLSFPSITRVLGSLPNPGLAQWKKRVGATEAARVSRVATTQGTAVHALAEAFLDNTLDESTLDITPNVRELWSRLRPWIAEHVQLMHAQEQDVYSTRLGVAGRVDLFATVNDELTVVDFKTASRPKDRAYVDNYFVQGTFYALAIFERTGLRVRRIVLPIVSPTQLQVFTGTPAEYFPKLQDAIRYFRAPLDDGSMIE